MNCRKDKLCKSCIELYITENKPIDLSNFCLHCKELVLKSFLDKNKKG